MPDVLLNKRLWLLVLLCCGNHSLAVDPTAPPAWARPAAPVVSAPAAGARVEVSLPKLQQIVMGEQSRAVINGRLLAVGDEVDGYRLISIGPDSVRLQSRQGVRELSLIKETLRESVAPVTAAETAPKAPDNKRTNR